MNASALGLLFECTPLSINRVEKAGCLLKLWKEKCGEVFLRVHDKKESENAVVTEGVVQENYLKVRADFLVLT